MYSYSNALTGAIPTQLGGLTALSLLLLGPYSLAYPPPSEVDDLCRTLNTSCPGAEGCKTSGCDRADVNGALCTSALQLCGVSAVCSAFELAVPSAADPTQCSACDHGAELLIVVPIAVLLLACAGLALLRRAMRKHPQHARRWLSTATIVYYHCLNITLIASMAIEWPPMMRQLGRILSLEKRPAVARAGVRPSSLKRPKRRRRTHAASLATTHTDRHCARPLPCAVQDANALAVPCVDLHVSRHVESSG